MNNFQHNWSRRQFLTTLTGASAAFLLNPFSAWANNDTDPKVAAIVAKSFAIDTHNHVDFPFDAEELSGLQTDLMSEMKKSGLAAICMTFAVDRPPIIKEGQAYERFLSTFDQMDKLLKINKIKRSLNLKDLQKAHRKHKPTVIQSVEGGHFLEGKIERLEVAHKRGLRLLGLLHDAQSSEPIGDIYTDPPKYGGLTDFGKNIIKECNRLGILIDLTHCSNDAINAALKVSSKPMLLTHTGLDTQLGNDEKFAKMMRPRLISKEQAKVFADTGGVIGVWTHLAATPLAYVQNVRAMIDIVGIDHVCIGTDTKMAKPFRPNSEIKKGRPGELTNAAWQTQTEGFYYTIVAEMLKNGFTESEIEKLSGGNFCKVFDEVTK